MLQVVEMSAGPGIIILQIVIEFRGRAKIKTAGPLVVAAEKYPAPAGGNRYELSGSEIVKTGYREAVKKLRTMALEKGYR